MSLADLEAQDEYWTLVNEEGLSDLGYPEESRAWPRYNRKFVGDRVAFDFDLESMTQPRSLNYNADISDVKILAHKDALKKVLPKMPKGFNIMRAFGWERDISGVIKSRYRNNSICLY